MYQTYPYLNDYNISDVHILMYTIKVYIFDIMPVICRTSQIGNYYHLILLLSGFEVGKFPVFYWMLQVLHEFICI